MQRMGMKLIFERNMTTKTGYQKNCTIIDPKMVYSQYAFIDLDNKFLVMI